MLATSLGNMIRNRLHLHCVWCAYWLQGRDKLQDAYYIFQEIIDKYGSSVSLFNCQSVCYIGQSKYEEADSAIQEAMDKDSNDSNTLVNAIVLSAHLSKPVEVSKCIPTYL